MFFRIHQKSFFDVMFSGNKASLAGQSFTIKYFSVAQISHTLKAVVNCISGLQSNHLKIPIYLQTMILIKNCIQ
jgi:hypothetical protein